MSRYIQIGDITIGIGHKYIFEDLSDIGSGNVRRNEVEFANADGAEFQSVFFEPRVFDIKGHIMAKSAQELHELKQGLINACYPKKDTEVIYFDGVRKYRAKARGDSLPEFGKKIKESCWFLPFVASIVIPSFYWEDYSITQLPIISRTDEITDTFTLPCVFTSRIAEAVIDNAGEFDIFPIVRISGGTTAQTGTIKIINNTIGQSIELSNYTINPNDIIVIDCENMTAVKNESDNIIGSINDFEDFRIVKGRNELKGLCAENVSGINVSIEYYRKWMGV